MGRQIRFFMLEEDENKFIKLAKDMDCKITDRKGKDIFVSRERGTGFKQYYLSFNESNIFINKNGYIDELKSDIIELDSCIIREDKNIDYGRLWLETQFYGDNGIIVKKEKWLEQKYNKMKRWIINNYRISEEKDFYIAEEAYKRYLDGSYDMMATPITKVKF